MKQEPESQQARPPHSEACERNKAPILDILRDVFATRSQVLEIGSGTGQHAVFFAEQLPQLRWQPADTGDFLPGLRARLAMQPANNIEPLVELDVRMNPWPVADVDAIFSANTLHFMSVACAEHFFRGVGQVLQPGGVLAVYGPFNYGGAFSSESNARFDVWLKQTDPLRGVRDFEWINGLAQAQGLDLHSDTDMPANNQLLVWTRRASS
jgi:SAM-dependent methyltransferase